MSSRVGKCIQCNKKLLVADTDGKFNAMKSEACQGDIVFDNKTKMRVLICEACSKAPNLDTIMENSSRSGAGLLDAAALNYIVTNCGAPRGLVNITNRRF